MRGDVIIFYTINCGNYGGSCYHVWFSKTRYSLPVSMHFLRPTLDILLTCGVTSSQATRGVNTPGTILFSCMLVLMLIML